MVEKARMEDIQEEIDGQIATRGGGLATMMTRKMIDEIVEAHGGTTEAEEGHIQGHARHRAKNVENETETAMMTALGDQTAGITTWEGLRVLYLLSPPLWQQRACQKERSSARNNHVHHHHQRKL